MKLSLLILSYLLIVKTCDPQPGKNGSVAVKDGSPQQATPIDFDKDIKPIFVRNCSPCHFPGGKMYERLPFDRDTTIIHHSAAILHRIKKEEENALLKKFIVQTKNGPHKEGHDE